jgi:hypothetical protein
LYVTDALGGRSQTVCRTSIERLARTDAVPTTALAAAALDRAGQLLSAHLAGAESVTA